MTLRTLAWLTAIAVLTVAGYAPGSGAREISDMYGRKHFLPDRARKVFSTSPVDTYLLYALDPEMLAGLNFPVKEKDRQYLHRHVTRIPVIGWFGQGQSPNRETLLAINPDIIFTSALDHALSSKVDQALKVMRMPVVELTIDRLSDYPDAFLRAGRILGRQQRARKLADYSCNTLAEARAIVARLPRDKKVSVYYAEGTDGLSTECDTSRHVELVGLAGGSNVHQCRERSPYGLEKISLEQVLVYNPEVILVMEERFYRNVFKDPIWKRIRAVKNGRVYLIPRHPINWFDRPPSFMRFIGLKWLLNSLYPAHYPIDIERETREFYQLFLGVDLSGKEIRSLLYR